PESVLDMPGMPARHPRNCCSPCSGIAARLGLESVLTLPRYTQSVDINTLGLTAEGKMVAQALQDFGAYVTDATGGTVAFYVEPTAPSSFASNLRRDAPKLRAVMRRVTNNSAATPNGPGARRVPMVPELAPLP
ncbi:hypothetical protein, partial [Myxococcus qinghaiensis]|uniref:hypothetical protein n=1 Tax=Myxococcus qinghaiensis TaxID=2906758 RepID=UPI0020A81398